MLKNLAMFVAIIVTSLLGVTTSAFGIGPLPPDFLYVDDDAPLAGDGLDWTTPMRHLQDAITAAEDYIAQGAVAIDIHVAGGMYKPDIDETGNVILGNRTESFYLFNHVTIRGGFRGLASGGIPDDHDIDMFQSVLSGDLLGDDLFGGSNLENSNHVVQSDGSNETAVLDGFTITAGYADGVFPNNSGAGFYNSNGTARIVNCRFVSNTAIGSGGGAYNTHADANFLNCVFENNTTAGGGGGAYNIYSSPTYVNCLFTGNTHTGINGEGGAMYQSPGGEATLINCTFYGNTNTQPNGGAVFIHPAGSASAIFTNCILWNNFAGGNPSQIWLAFSDPLSATVNFSCLEGGWSGSGSNNTSSDPMFVDTTSGDYQLGVGSSAIDAGDSTGVPVEADLDLARNPRIVDDMNHNDVGVPDVFGNVVDMGAYEVQMVDPCFGDLNVDGTVDIHDLLELIGAWGSCNACPADINGDNVVNITDLLELIGAWGACP